MTYDELNDEQRFELKQRILAERNEQRDEGTSYGELADADDLVSDEDARDWAEGMDFSSDDFSCSASGPNERVEDVPQWAVNYIMNSDPSGLTDEDQAMVDGWILGLACGGLQLLCPIDGSENEFCSLPAFGLACNTVDFMAVRQQSHVATRKDQHNRRGASDMYFLVVEEWNYPTESGQDPDQVVYYSLDEALDACEVMARAEMHNFSDVTELDCLPPARCDDGFILTTKMGLDPFYYFVRVVPVVSRMRWVLDKVDDNVRKARKEREQ